MLLSSNGYDQDGARTSPIRSPVGNDASMSFTETVEKSEISLDLQKNEDGSVYFEKKVTFRRVEFDCSGVCKPVSWTTVAIV